MIKASIMSRQPVTRAIAYVRVSTSRQVEEGSSLEAQKAKLVQYAGLYGLEIVAMEVDEAESAGTLSRPALQRALARLRAGEADAILVTKLDRLTRSVRDLGHLLEEYFAPGQASLLSVGEQIDARTASGRMVLNILASVGQWERETTAERTRDVRRYLDKQNRFGGGPPPYGKRVEAGQLVDEPSELATIATAKALAARGMGVRCIARELAIQGAHARNGRPFAPMQVKRMLAA